MSHNNYKYHIISSAVPDAMLVLHGYPIKAECFNSDDELCICFHGKKTTNLELDFEAYLIANPPSYMTKTINMTQSEIKIIVRNHLYKKPVIEGLKK